MEAAFALKRRAQARRSIGLGRYAHEETRNSTFSRCNTEQRIAFNEQHHGVRGCFNRQAIGQVVPTKQMVLPVTIDKVFTKASQIRLFGRATISWTLAQL